MEVTAMEKKFLYLIPRNRRPSTSRSVHEEAPCLVRRWRGQGQVWARDFTVSSRKEHASRPGRLDIGWFE